MVLSLFWKCFYYADWFININSLFHRGFVIPRKISSSSFINTPSIYNKPYFLHGCSMLPHANNKLFICRIMSNQKDKLGDNAKTGKCVINTMQLTFWLKRGWLQKNQINQSILVGVEFFGASLNHAELFWKKYNYDKIFVIMNIFEISKRNETEESFF